MEVRLLCRGRDPLQQPQAWVLGPCLSPQAWELPVPESRKRPRAGQNFLLSAGSGGLALKQQGLDEPPLRPLVWLETEQPGEMLEQRAELPVESAAERVEQRVELPVESAAERVEQRVELPAESAAERVEQHVELLSEVVVPSP